MFQGFTRSSVLQLQKDPHSDLTAMTIRVVEPFSPKNLSRALVLEPAEVRNLLDAVTVCALQGRGYHVTVASWTLLDGVSRTLEVRRHTFSVRIGIYDSNGGYACFRISWRVLDEIWAEMMVSV